MIYSNNIKNINHSWNKNHNFSDIIWPEKKTITDYRCKIFKIDLSTFVHPETQKDYQMVQLNCSDWVNVFALTENQKLIVIEQFRFGNSQVTLETPGGAIEDKEDPLTAATRELVEETGFSPQTIEPIGESYPNPAIQKNKIYYYLATNCVLKKRNLDEGEVINTALVSLEDFTKLVFTGKIEHSLVLTGFLFFQKAIAKLKLNH